MLNRNISGYVWLDTNFDGTLQSGEPRLQGVEVGLYRYVADESGSYTLARDNPVMVTQTNADGFYQFRNVYDASVNSENPPKYEIRFSDPEEGEISDGKGETMKLSDLYLSRGLAESYVGNVIGSRNIAHVEDDDAAGSLGKFYITQQTLPTAQEIWQLENIGYGANGKIENYSYTRQYQNLAVATADYRKIVCSLGVTKVDADSGAPMAGVKFRLEKLEDQSAGEEYSTVHFTYDAAEGVYVYDATPYVEGNADQYLEVATDGTGKIRFTQLPIGDYRLVEVSTVSGYNLLAAPIPISLPYTIENAALVEGTEDTYISQDQQITAVVGNTDLNYRDGWNNSFFNITIRITNSKLPHLPETGAFDNFTSLYASAIALTAALTLFAAAGYGRKKRGK